jgi:N-acyl homoserine lactone hydrolase
MKSLGLGLAIVLAAMASPGAQTADRLYVMDCGHNSAKDRSLWSPGVNVRKLIEQPDTWSLIKHGSQWLLWDTGYPDASAEPPVDTPVGHATRAKTLAAQLAELGSSPRTSRSWRSRTRTPTMSATSINSQLRCC